MLTRPGSVRSTSCGLSKYWAQAVLHDREPPVITDSSTRSSSSTRLACRHHARPPRIGGPLLPEEHGDPQLLAAHATPTSCTSPGRGFLTTAAHRAARWRRSTAEHLQAVFTGRATIRNPGLPGAHDAARIRDPGHPVRPAALATLVKTLPSAQKTFTIGYDSSSPEQPARGQPAVGRVQRAGLTVTVQAYRRADLRLAPPAKTAKARPTSARCDGRTLHRPTCGRTSASTRAAA